MTRLRCLAAPLLLAAATGAAAAYPDKPIRLVAPCVPGGPTDIVARVVAQRLGQALGQNVVVDNRGGASGAIGCEIVARSAPDGYTLMIGSSGNLAVAPALFAKLPYDPLKDFQPITQTTSGPQIVVVNANLPVRSFGDFLALARAKPGSLNYASGGAGTTTQLGPELLKSMAKIDLVHVPYKGTGQALADVIGGQVQLMMSSLLPALPEVPTVAESGVPGFETTSWHGMVMPARAPAALLARLHAEMVRLLNNAETKALFLAQGMETVGNTPQEFDAYIRGENAKWTKVIKDIGLPPQ